MKNTGIGLTLTETLSFCFQQSERPFHQLSADSACASTLAVFKQIFFKIEPDHISVILTPPILSKPISVTAIFSKRNPAGRPCELFCPPSALRTSSYLHVNLFVRSETSRKKKNSALNIGESLVKVTVFIFLYGFTRQKEDHSILNQPSASDWGQVFFLSQI